MKRIEYGGFPEILKLYAVLTLGEIVFGWQYGKSSETIEPQAGIRGNDHAEKTTIIPSNCFDHEALY
jgi:hypothetical protein